MKIAKKSLSLFLSLLMILTSCSVGLFGITAFAAEGDSKYQKSEVVTLINAAVANGYSAKSSGNATNITGDNGAVLAAADAIFDYAVKTYREGRKADSAYNSGDTLLAKFISDFSGSFSGTALNAMKALATDVLNPNGTTLYGYPTKVAGSTLTENSSSWTIVNIGVNPKRSEGEHSDEDWIQPYYSSAVKEVTKTVAIEVDINKFLQAYDSIEDIPASFLTSVSYTYAHAIGKYAYTTNREEGNWRKKYYVSTTTTESWNYMSAKPVRIVAKNTTAKKYLKSIDKFFNADRLALTLDDLLAMSLADLEYLNTQADGFRTMMNENFSAATLTHFGFAPSKINTLIDNINFAYRAVAAKAAIDTLNNYIGSEYNEESYSAMASLYSKVKSAYDIVFSLKQDTIDYIVGDGGYAEQYEDALALKTTADAYIATLHAIMTEQRLEELVASMTAKYNQYYSLLNKEDIETPTDDEITHLVSQVASWNGILATYTGYSYYRTYYTTEHEAAWNDFCAKLNEVAEVRGLKADYLDFYNWFYYLLYTTEISDASDDQLMDIYEETETRLGELRAKYNEIVDKYDSYTIADKIFTINYEGSDYLLQTLIENSKTAGFAAIKAELVDRAEADLDAVMVYSGVTTVNFENFADIKSTISHYNYDLYDYVTGGNREGTNWLAQAYVDKHAQVQTLLDKYHAFSTTDGKAFFNENFTFADANGLYATRYAGDQTVEVEGEDENGNPITTTEQIGYPNDIARDGADDNYYVDEEVLLDTVVRIDNFITGRDFGALIGLVDTETEEATDLKTFVNQMLEEMLFNDEMMNNLVGAIFPMICELIENELVGAIGGMDGARVDENGIPWLDLNALAGIGGELALYLDTATAPSHDGGNQKDFPTLFAELGLYIYPSTLADSLAVSNPSFYGKDSDIYKALKAAGRDWTKLVSEDDPETLNVDETKALEFVWGVYDQDSFFDAVACVLDSILPILQAVLTTAGYSEEVSNAAIAYSPELLTVDDVFIRGGLELTIEPLNAYSTLLKPLFQVLGVTNIPNLSSSCDGYDIVTAIFGTLLKRVDEILDAPLDSILSILPNLVYFLSMDSVQEIIDGLNIKLNLNIHEVEVIDFSGLLGYLLDGVDGILADKINFDINLAISDLLDLYDLLGFEITNFNEVLNFLLPTLGLDIALPPIKQQEIIFCSDWTTRADGSVNLVANKGDLMYWFLDYIVSALVPDENGNSLITALMGDTEMDPTLKGLLDKVVMQVTHNPDGALAAIVELLNPATYDLEEMDWIEQGDWNYNDIEGANQMSIVYLNYGNDWTREDAEYLVNNIDSLLASVLDMAGVEMDDLGAYLQDMVNGLFTNENITALVEMLGGLGDSPSGVIADIFTNQIGLDLESWFLAFGYLYPAETWAEDAEIIAPDSLLYVNNFGVEGVANEDGTISWFFNRMPLVDGDGYTFINILSRLLGGMSVAVDFLFGGKDISAFEDLLIVKGYETYDTSIGLLLTMLGVENIPTQADFAADSMGSLTNTLTAVLDWFYALTDSDDMIAQILELVPDLFYFIESNGLSTLLHNLLMPVLVLVDTVRPLMDVDINGLLSLIVSEFLNYGTLDFNVILQYLVHGIYLNDDFDFVYYAVDINNLRLSDILPIADAYLGTNLASSGLVDIGIKGLCSGVEPVTGTAVGDIYRTTVTAADTVTIIVTAIIDCLSYPAKDATKTNGDAICELIAEKTEKPELAGLYTSIKEIIDGIVYEYDSPNWGYMFENSDLFTLDLPEQTIVYLGYTTDWDAETADTVYAALDEILDMILPEVLEEGETLATLLNGVLEDNVYSDEILDTIIEGLVGLLVNLDATLFELVDVVVDTDITAWFDMCDITTDEEGKKVVDCTKTWGIDAAAEADKKDLFVAAIKEVLAPANELLAWLFFGTEYAFFTSSEVDDNGDYTYADLITLNGGEGYAYGLVPLFEALGCTMQPAATFYDAATDSYNVGAAVESILNSVLALVDEVTANPVEEVFNLLPNLIYFINADGAKVVVNNLLAPVNAILEKLSPVVGDVSIGGLLVDTIGFDICNITMETLLKLAVDNGVVLSDDMINILADLYVGKLAEFTSANGRTAYRLDVTGYEGDVLTIILSLAIDLFNLNEELFAPLLGAENYAAIVALLGGLDIDKNYLDMNWAYMYDGDLDKLNNDGFPEQTIEYLGYKTDWDEETAAAVYGALDDILDLVLPAVLDEGDNIATLLNGLLTDNVYTDDVLNSLVELIVNGLANLDSAIYDAAGALLDADISTWFSFCELKDGEYVCTKNWGVDAAAEADKKDVFVAGIKEVLNPANKLLSWLFFGEQYTLLNGTTKDVLVTLNGGQGYAYGLVPIFEALGCKVQPAEAFYNAETKSYDVGAAVESLLDAALILVDEISANPVEEVFTLLPNLIYFINADGAKVAVNNLLAPVNAVLDCLSGLVGDVSIGSLLEETVGFDICDITMDTLIGIAADYDFVITDEMAYVLKNLYVGVPTAFDSVNGRTAYAVAYDDGNPAHEMLTILLSFALEAFTINETLFADLLGEETYWAVRNIISDTTEEFEYLDINWGYMYEGDDLAARIEALKAANGVLPERTNAAYDVYTLYQNNWNEATADYVALVLDTLVHDITTAVRSDGSTLGDIIDKAISDELYQNSILNSLIEMVVELLLDYEEIVAGAGALLGAERLADWFDYCEITEDENGENVVTCTVDWGIDSKETIDEKRVAFVDAFAKVLEPAYDLLAWLFFAEDYTFFSATTGEALITLSGGKGYEEALVPLLEGAGVTMAGSIPETYLKGTSSVVPASYFYVNGELDMELAVKTIFGAVTGWLVDICGDLDNQASDGALSSMLEKLANFIYFVNADGLVAVVNNLTAPVMRVVNELDAFGVDIDFNELIGIEGMDIFNFQFDDVFALLEDLLDLHFPVYTQEFLKTFYIGEVVEFRSANGDTAFFMTYTEEESVADMITCLIGFVVDAFRDERNAACLIDWFGDEDIYNGIMAVLGLNGVKEMQEFDWLYTEYADTDHELNATESSVKYSVAYNNIWTRDKAQYISQNLIPFVNNILGLIGLELEGYEIKNVDDLIDSLLNGKLYTQETVDMILDLVRDLVSKLTELEPYGEYIVGILDTAFGVDLTAWDTMKPVVADGDKDAFVAALGEILAPVVPLLDVLLCGENIELFYTIEPENVGKSAITIYGSEGYAYGIIPIFEALGCEMLTPEEFKALSNEDKAASLVNSLLDRIDVIAVDPVTEIFKMIPELVYFINSNGLDTAVNNILNSVDTVLIALEPIVGATSLMELLGVDLAEYNMDYLVNMACEAIEESTGLDCEPLIVDFVAELTMGKVISYQSANGETYYKMVFANEDQMTDMVTVILRLVFDFLATGENADAIIALIANNSESEEAADSASTLINFVLTAANTEPITSGAMATIYYIFYGLNNGVEGIDYLYGNYGKSWDALVGFFEESEDSYYVKAAEVLKAILKEIGGIDTDSSVADCDCDCHNNSGFIRFFFKIITFLRKLFGMKEFQYCDCGAAHW